MNNHNLHNRKGDELNDELTLLLSKIRSIDADNKTKHRSFIILYAILTVFYSFLIILHPNLKLLLITGGIILFLVVFTFNYLKTTSRDYSIPLKELLMEIRKTYRFVTPMFVLINIGALGLIFAGFDSLFNNYINLSDSFYTVLISIGVYLTALVIGYYTWKKRYASVIRHIDNCIKELEE